MRKMILLMLTMVLFGALTVACESEQEKETKRLAAEWEVRQENALPADWQALVKKDMHQRLTDPDSAQYNFLGEPAKTTVDGVEHWLLGVDINAKNSFGGYVGYKVWMIAIRNGEVVYAKIAPEEIARGFREDSKAAKKADDSAWARFLHAAGAVLHLQK